MTSAASFTAPVVPSGCFRGLGDGDDLDVAFDDAVARVSYELGHCPGFANLAQVPAGSAEVVCSDPVPASLAMLLAVRELHEELDPGTLRARAVGPDALQTRVRVRVVVEDVTDPLFDLITEAGAVEHVSAQLQLRLLELAGADVPEGGQLLSVDVATRSSRFRPLTEAFKAPSGSQFVVLGATTRLVVSSGHATASAARRAAVDLVKTGGVDGSETGVLEVFKLAGRAEGAPFARVSRDRVRGRIVLRLVFGVANVKARVRTTGWLFYGSAATVD